MTPLEFTLIIVKDTKVFCPYCLGSLLVQEYFEIIIYYFCAIGKYIDVGIGEITEKVEFSLKPVRAFL